MTSPTCVIVGVPQLSVAETDEILAAGICDSHSTVTSDGFAVITGFSLSRTVTVNEQVEVLPDASVALTLTVFIPTGKSYPPFNGIFAAPLISSQFTPLVPDLVCTSTRQPSVTKIVKGT